MPCYGCGEKFRDKGGTVTRSTYHSLCYDCMLEVLEVYESTPERRLKVLRHLVAKGVGRRVPGIGMLIKEQLDEIEVRKLNPTDRMFNPREG